MVERNENESPVRRIRSRGLFHINGEGFGDSANLSLIRTYSRLKYGAPEVIATYAEQVSKKLSDEVRLDDAFIVTPPYSRLVPSVIPLATAITQILEIPHAELRTRVGGDKNVIYASLKTQGDRNASRTNVGVFLRDDEKFRSLRAILFDDMETTGVTFDQMGKVVSIYSIPVVGAYSVAILDASDPTREEWVNTFSLNNELDVLVQIINSPETVINRHTLKSLLNLPEETRTEIMKYFTPEAVDKFNNARNLYYNIINTKNVPD